MNIKKEILHISKTFLVVMILFFAVQFIYAWAGPNLPPPQDNTETPINVSSTAQAKTGVLTVGGLTLPAGATITGNGTNSNYGATTIKGSKNNYSGINFKDSSNANSGTLMMHPTYSGFFNGADSNWRMYVIETGVAGQMGNVVANDFYSNAAGKYMSALQSRVTGTCPAGQAIMSISANGTVTCTVAAAPTLRYYQCPSIGAGNCGAMVAPNYPCNGNQSAINYCNQITGYWGNGNCAVTQYSCTPVYQ